MEDKRLRKLNKYDLLELLVEQERELVEIQKQLEAAKKDVQAQTAQAESYKALAQKIIMSHASQGEMNAEQLLLQTNDVDLSERTEGTEYVAAPEGKPEQPIPVQSQPSALPSVEIEISAEKQEEAKNSWRMPFPEVIGGRETRKEAEKQHTVPKRMDVIPAIGANPSSNVTPESEIMENDMADKEKKRREEMLRRIQNGSFVYSAKK